MNQNELLLFNKFSLDLKESKRNYLYMLNEFKAHVNKNLLDVTPEDISSYINSLNNNSGTKRRKYYELLSFYNFLFDELLIKTNPVSTISPPNSDNQIKLDRTLLLVNVKLFLNTLFEHFSLRDFVITLIIATTGLRVSEVLNIKWSDFIIDDNSHIGVNVGNENNIRYVRIFDFVWKMINKYRIDLEIPDYYLKEKYIVFFPENQLNLYRTNPQLVKPITALWLRKVYAKACNIADIPYITAKDIRHNYTMLCMNLGSPEEEIKEQLGWSSTDFIYRYHGVVELLDSPINKKVEEYYTELLEV
ncbi:site-specific integrase [Tissierella carlieri]|uniref:Site-specific integrase n=1 Tax=Tissierella carlieri TaxID=689904 RepID=A0ABT1SF01_9FIRM|nr:site-specific integrase [Tissierella carlieri]MCQ4925054.1 site-specific integrase [Tissierella carlieri]